MSIGVDHNMIWIEFIASPRPPYRFSWDGVALIATSIGSIAALYFLG